jgi:hypothetical protein
VPGSPAISVLDAGQPVNFSFEEMLRYSGPRSPGGVAHAFKVMELGFALLGGELERGEVVVETAFGGPGARDAFELVTRAVTDGRYVVDPSLARPERGVALERFVFRLGYPDRAAVTVQAREGFVTDEFIDIARTEGRDADQERRLDVLKRELADRVVSSPPAAVFDVD